MSTIADDTLYAEMISLLRDIRGQQETAAQKSAALERAMLALNQGFKALDDKRMAALVAALWGLVAAAWGLVAAALIAGALVAAAITWGV